MMRQSVTDPDGLPWPASR